MKRLFVTAAIIIPFGIGLSALRGDRNGDTGRKDASVNLATGEYIHGVIGGPHDFSLVSGRPSDACNTCHVPHMQAVRVTSQPSTRPALDMFAIKGQRRVFEPGRFTPGPTSLICLGCHDGTVAGSTIGSAHAVLAGVHEGFAAPNGFVWRDHPIGVPYSNDRHEFRQESYVTAEGIRLPEGRIECVSCHDPHNLLGIDKMLLMSNRRSKLCLTCHIK